MVRHRIGTVPVSVTMVTMPAAQMSMTGSRTTEVIPKRTACFLLATEARASSDTAVQHKSNGTRSTAWIELSNSVIARRATPKTTSPRRNRSRKPFCAGTARVTAASAAIRTAGVISRPRAQTSGKSSRLFHRWRDGSPVGGGAWSSLPGGPSSSVKRGFSASAHTW